jgi:hypothetical protein
MGTVGLLAGPPIIGFIANASNLAWGMSAVAVSALLVSLCATQIRWPDRSAGRLNHAGIGEDSMS